MTIWELEKFLVEEGYTPSYSLKDLEEEMPDNSTDFETFHLSSRFLDRTKIDYLLISLHRHTPYGKFNTG